MPAQNTAELGGQTIDIDERRRALSEVDRIVPLHLTVRDAQLLDRLCERQAPEGIDWRDPAYQAGVCASIVGDRLRQERDEEAVTQ